MPYYFERAQSHQWFKWKGTDVVLIRGKDGIYKGVKLAPAEQDKKGQQLEIAEVQVEENSRCYAVPLMYSSPIFPGQKGNICSEGFDIVDAESRIIEARVIFSAKEIK